MGTARDVDRANAQFWNELCGSHLARQLGITENTVESRRRFDQAFLGFYPYLLDHVPPSPMAGRKVMEVGLGYGTLGERIAEAGADYLGLDVAEGRWR